MSKHKRKSDLENVAEDPNVRFKAKRGKGWKTGLATLTICGASFGAYYSPHFRAASSDWLERGREAWATWAHSDDKSQKNAPSDDKIGEMLAQAPSFRDFLTDEYGEEEARELLGIDATTPASTIPGTESDERAVAPSVVWKNAETQEIAVDDSTSFPAPEAEQSFADYVAAESASTESFETQEMEDGVDALLNAPFPEAKPSFADYVAAEDGATQDDGASENDASSSGAESEANFGNYAAAKPAVDFEADGSTVNDEKTRLASAVESVAVDEDEAALTKRLQNEMAERGVGNPRVERWGGRFWRASGFATTDGVATFCEAVDVDPTAAQRAALAKFDAARF